MNTNIRSIKVLGSNCPLCKRLHEITEEAAKEIGISVPVEYIDDIQKILDIGVMSAPILLINEKPVLAGGYPTLDKVKEILDSYSTL